MFGKYPIGNLGKVAAGVAGAIAMDTDLAVAGSKDYISVGGPRTNSAYKAEAPAHPNTGKRVDIVAGKMQDPKTGEWIVRAMLHDGPRANQPETVAKYPKDAQVDFMVPFHVGPNGKMALQYTVTFPGGTKTNYAVFDNTFMDPEGKEPCFSEPIPFENPVRKRDGKKR
jgi:hypothetical protein